MYLGERLKDGEVLFVCLFVYPEVKDRKWTGKLRSLKYHDAVFIEREKSRGLIKLKSHSSWDVYWDGKKPWAN
jgi:hypothetical protein